LIIFLKVLPFYEPFSSHIFDRLSTLTIHGLAQNQFQNLKKIAAAEGYNFTPFRLKSRP
jgi:hypothetical protein